MLSISYSVDYPHMEGEIIQVISAILSHIGSDKPGVILEDGFYKGGNTTKLSLAAKLESRKLVTFDDSFAGCLNIMKFMGKIFSAEMLILLRVVTLGR